MIFYYLTFFQFYFLIFLFFNNGGSMNFDYDVAIIGAGPIGSTLAYKLAKEDLKISFN